MRRRYLVMTEYIKTGLYQHYKGNYYQVIGLSRHSETLDSLVVYQSLYGDYGLWVRPVELFQSLIEYDNQEVPRFKFVSETVSQLPGIR